MGFIQLDFAFVIFITEFSSFFLSEGEPTLVSIFSWEHSFIEKSIRYNQTGFFLAIALAQDRQVSLALATADRIWPAIRNESLKCFFVLKTMDEVPSITSMHCSPSDRKWSQFPNNRG